MRLWSLHPSYLDPKGLVALWREALLAQAVLAGRTRGYRHHPQLARFRGEVLPPLSPRRAVTGGARGAPEADAVGLARVAAYLWAVHEEATGRGYRFDARKIGGPCEDPSGPTEAPREPAEGEPWGRADGQGARWRLTVTDGQLRYEREHLLAKLAARAPGLRGPLLADAPPRPHPLFTAVPGPVEPWEVRAS